jgi:hypothetical protein
MHSKWANHARRQRFQKAVALPISLAAAACCLSVPTTANARVTRFVVEQTRVFADGRSFGDVGQYQRLDGTAYFEVDPADRANSVVVNIKKAPRNANGMVEFSTPFFILKPTSMKKGNHKIFYGINNRGNKQTLGYFNNTPPTANLNDPITSDDAGNGWMMRQGYAVVDAGWQGDVAPGNARLIPNFPVATQNDGSPIVSPVRIQYSDRTIRIPAPSRSRWKEACPRTSRSRRTRPRTRTPRIRRSRCRARSTLPRWLSRPTNGPSAPVPTARTAWFRRRRTSACSAASRPANSTSSSIPRRIRS